MYTFCYVILAKNIPFYKNNQCSLLFYIDKQVYFFYSSYLQIKQLQKDIFLFQKKKKIMLEKKAL